MKINLIYQPWSMLGSEKYIFLSIYFLNLSTLPQSSFFATDFCLNYYIISYIFYIEKALYTWNFDLPMLPIGNSTAVLITSSFPFTYLAKYFYPGSAFKNRIPQQYHTHTQQFNLFIYCMMIMIFQKETLTEMAIWFEET